MESKAKYLFVGIMMTVLTVCLIAFVLWVAEAGSQRQVKSYTIYFKEHSLSGLQVDSKVTMRGIKIGTVSEFQISPTNVEVVKVLITIAKKTPVKQDTSAVIKRNLLTGLATIDLVGTSKDSPYLTQRQKGEQHPIISEGRTELEQIADSVPGLVDDLGELLQRGRQIFSEENVKSINITVKNAETFSTALANEAETLKGFTAKLEATADNMQKLGDSLTKTSNKAGTQITKLGGELSTTLAQITITAARLEKESAAASKVMQRGITRIVLELSNLAENISQAAQAFTLTIEQFEDPRTLLVGPSDEALGPGEKQQREQ